MHELRTPGNRRCVAAPPASGCFFRLDRRPATFSVRLQVCDISIIIRSRLNPTPGIISALICMSQETKPSPAKLIPEMKIPKIERQGGYVLFGLKCFFLSLLIILGACILLDRVVIPFMVRSAMLQDNEWVHESDKIVEYMYARNLADEQLPVWRSSAYPVLEEKQKAKRILVVGDSFVWGHGYPSLNSVWWRQLQLELGRRGYKDVEVIAAGMNGHNTRRELNLMKELVPRYRPDMVIVGYVSNDPEEVDKSTGEDFIKPFLFDDLKDDMPEWVSQAILNAFPNLGDSLLATRRNSLMMRMLATGKEFNVQDWEAVLLKGPGFEQYKETVKDAGKFVRESKIPIVWMTLPFTCEPKRNQPNEPFLEHYKKYFNARYEPVKKLFAQENIPFIDILDGVIPVIQADKKMMEDRWVGINPVDQHSNTVITHYYAVQAADLLESKYPQVLGARGQPSFDTASQAKIIDWVPPALQVRPASTNKFTLVYPGSDAELLWLPFKKPYALLTLDKPLPVTEIQISGRCVVSAELYVSVFDPIKKFDNAELHPISIDRQFKSPGVKEGKTIVWKMSALSQSDGSQSESPVGTVGLHIKFKGPERVVQLEFKS